MALTFYKSENDNGGAKGDQIADGAVDAILPPISAGDRLDGITILRKLWIESDEDIDLLYGIGNDGLFQAYGFVSANDGDTTADLTGNERLIAGLKIVSNTASALTVEDDDESEVVQADDYLTVGNEITRVDSVTDNGDGTWTINLKSDLTGGDYSGQWAVIQFRRSVTAGNAIPLWVKVVIPPLSNAQDDYNIIPVTCSW